MATYVAKPAEVERKWWVVDATDKPLGRLASQVASVLRGKHKPIFTPHMDAGDFVIVINAEKVKLTGNKLDGKLYTRTPASRAATKSAPTAGCSSTRRSSRSSAPCTGMLPKGPLGRQVATKLKVYAGSTHPHAAQKPAALDLMRVIQSDDARSTAKRTARAGARTRSPACSSSPAAATSPSTAARSNEYFPRPTSQMIVRQALEVVEKSSEFDVTVNVCGGGESGQAGAVRHGISRALLVVDAALRAQAEGRRLPHARRAQERAQEARPARRPQALPVQQALSLRRGPREPSSGRRTEYAPVRRRRRATR